MFSQIDLPYYSRLLFLRLTLWRALPSQYQKPNATFFALEYKSFWSYVSVLTFWSSKSCARARSNVRTVWSSCFDVTPFTYIVVQLYQVRVLVRANVKNRLVFVFVRVDRSLCSCSNKFAFGSQKLQTYDLCPAGSPNEASRTPCALTS